MTLPSLRRRTELGLFRASVVAPVADPAAGAFPLGWEVAPP
jgi:hypothetical protein